jgi:hypothetical protein
VERSSEPSHPPGANRPEGTSLLIIRQWLGFPCCGGKDRTRLGAPVAIKAMAAKLARLVYRMLGYGMKYVDKGAATYQEQHRQLQIKQLKWKAATLGYQLIGVPAA